LSPTELTDALAFADAATVLLLKLQAEETGTDLPLDLAPAVEARAEVHQASGMVSVHAGVTLAVALVMVRARAYADQRPIAEVARDILRGFIRLGEDDDG
jgi:hypothetical protein